MKTSCIIFLATLFIFNLQAQSEVNPNIVGENHEIHSEVLDEIRQIQIYLPQDYEASNTEYPVLYILDGQRFFLHAVSLSEYFAEFNLAPAFIVVGITNKYPQRFEYFSEATRFTKFIEEELQPFINRTFRSSQENILFGWEFGGSLSLDILINHPILFSGYIISSPYPITEKLKSLDTTLKSNKSLFFSVSPHEFEVTDGVNLLDSVLSNNVKGGLDWRYLKLDQEEHRSTAYTTLYHGLRWYFRYFPEFEEDVLDRLLEAGGLDHVNSYVRERANRYGFTPSLTAWSKFTIIRSAIRANNYEEFKTFVDSFFTIEFVRELDNEHRALSIVDFFSANDQYDQAVEGYKMLLEEYPTSTNLLTRLGNTLLKLGNKEEGERHLQKAKEISENRN